MCFLRFTDDTCFCRSEACPRRERHDPTEDLWEPSLLAMASAPPTSMLDDRPPSRASLAPTGSPASGRLLPKHLTLWELSLLAMASARPPPMLHHRPPSRASLAPTGSPASCRLLPKHQTLWELSLLAMASARPPLMLDDKPPSRASLAPTGSPAVARSCHNTKPCGSRACSR